MCDEYDKTADMASDYNDTIIDTNDYQSEVGTVHNHNYVDIS